MSNNKFWSDTFASTAYGILCTISSKQHYFLCHDILEEAWKAQPTFSKDDPVVALILLATACYHHRRGNFKGAHRSYKKALTVCRHHDKLTFQALGVDYHQFENELRQLIESTEQKERYTLLLSH